MMKFASAAANGFGGLAIPARGFRGRSSDEGSESLLLLLLLLLLLSGAAFLGAARSVHLPGRRPALALGAVVLADCALGLLEASGSRRVTDEPVRGQTRRSDCDAL
jgi:hypothetical protein